jgi:hypothetical protein
MSNLNFYISRAQGHNQAISVNHFINENFSKYLKKIFYEVAATVDPKTSLVLDLKIEGDNLYGAIDNIDDDVNATTTAGVSYELIGKVKDFIDFEMIGSDGIAKLKEDKMGEIKQYFKTTKNFNLNSFNTTTISNKRSEYNIVLDFGEGRNGITNIFNKLAKPASGGSGSFEVSLVDFTQANPLKTEAVSILEKRLDGSTYLTKFFEKGQAFYRLKKEYRKNPEKVLNLLEELYGDLKSSLTFKLTPKKIPLIVTLKKSDVEKIRSKGSTTPSTT